MAQAASADSPLEAFISRETMTSAASKGNKGPLNFLNLLWMLAVFVGDLMTPLGIAWGTLYIGSVLICMFVNDRKTLVNTGVAAIMLIVLGSFLSSRNDVSDLQFLTNRLISLFVVATGLFFALKIWQFNSKLALQNERLFITLSSIGDGVIITNANGDIILMNKTAEKMTGWSAEKAHLKSLDAVFKIINAQTRSPVDNPVGKVLASRTIAGLANDTLLISTDGTERQIADSAAPILIEGELEGTILVFSDVTDKYHLQGQLVQKNKLESIGKLAGGIAHDFNNLLQIIQGTSEALLIDNLKPQRFDKYVHTIQRACTRATSITAQILAFGKRQVMLPRDINVFSALTRNAELIERLMIASIRIEILPFQKNLTAYVDESQLDQVIMNICVNAIDAMPHGGHLTLEAFSTELHDTDSVLNPDVLIGKAVGIVIKDTGMGMSPEIVSSVFEPYFTTKDASKGSGLGLATAYGIIQQSGGTISVESELEIGSAFTILLPSKNEQDTDTVINHQDLFMPTVEPLVIALVEDDKDVRELIHDALSSRNHSVMAFDHPQSAETYICNLNNQIDLLITDCVMPGISGIALHNRCQNLRAGIPALFISGYPKGEAMVKEGLQDTANYLRKPFTTHQLLIAIQAVMKERKV